jgi:hypothetical protein
MRDWQTVRSELESWEVALPGERAWPSHRLTRWAAAAALFLGIGLVLGRLSGPSSAELEALHARLLPQLRQELREEFAQESQRAVNRALPSLKAELSAELDAGLALAEGRRQEDLLWLRRDLETIAVSADARLGDAQRQLSQLVTYRRPRMAE